MPVSELLGERKLDLHIRLEPRVVARALAICIGSLTVGHLAVLLVVHGLGVENGYGTFRLLDFHAEANIPTLYQTLALLGCALILFAIWQAKRRLHDAFRRWWLVLAVTFSYLAIDEASEIHELASAPARLLVEPVGVLRRTWVLLAVPAVLLFALAFVRFLRHLPAPYRAAFVGCGAVFVAGAVGGEILGGVYLDNVGAYDGGYALIATAEELLEKVGIAAFLVTLLAYLRDTAHGVRIGFD